MLIRTVSSKPLCGAILAALVDADSDALDPPLGPLLEEEAVGAADGRAEVEAVADVVVAEPLAPEPAAEAEIGAAAGEGMTIDCRL